MSPQAEPKRLLEQPGSDLDVLLLESALDEAPPARAVDRTLVALGVASAATGLCAGTASTAAVKTGIGSGVGGAGWFGSLSIVSKLGMGIALVSASVGVPYVLLRDPAAASAPALQAVVAGEQASGEKADAAATTPSRPDGAPASIAPAADATKPSDLEPSREAGSKPVARPASTVPTSTGPTSTVPTSTVPTSTGPTSTGPTSGAKAQAAAGGASEPSGGKSPSAQAPGGLAEERKLLDAARSALRRGDKAASLAHLDAYAARFPNGQLKPEAQSMRQAASQ